MADENKKTSKKANGKVAGKITEKSKTIVKAKTGSKTADKTAAGVTENKIIRKAAGNTLSKPNLSKPKILSAGKIRKTIPLKTAGIEDAKQAPIIITQEFIDKMEQSLLDLKASIVENLISNSNDFKEIVEGMDAKDFVDIASDDIDRKMIEAIGYQELKRLKLIESAITRIKQGKYGHCIKCEKHIPPDRLEAIPYALMCIGCKIEEERRNR